MPILKNSTQNLFLKLFWAIFLSIFFASSAKAIVEFPSTSNYPTVNALTTAVINWFLSITAGVTIFFLIIGGIYYLTAFGDEKRMELGKKIISYAVYGLIMILISYSIVTTLNTIIFS